MQGVNKDASAALCREHFADTSLVCCLLREQKLLVYGNGQIAGVAEGMRRLYIGVD